MKQFKKIFIFTFLIILVLIFFIWQNNDIVITEYDYSNDKIPSSFHNFKILQVSDLHNKLFSQNQERLINHTKNINPDIIVITGDLIDRRKTNIANAMIYIKEAIKIAPIYYVSGNHEVNSNLYDELIAQLIINDVIVLEDINLRLTINNQSINLIGISDFSYIHSNHDLLNNQLQKLVDTNSFNILLSHRPELFKYYELNKVELTFAGHAHGGQIRLPLIGGIIAPNQGFLPEYTHGVYEHNNSTMIVSRGLGNSIMPIRIFNRPELVVVTLKTESY